MNDNALIAWLIRKHINPGAGQNKVLNLLNRANPDEIKILADLMRIIQAQQHFVEVMRGAHVEIFDGCMRYEAWRVLQTADSRKSSHRSEGTQYQVVGPFCTTILFGKRGYITWLQLEEHPWGGIKNSILHSVDFVQYKISGKNQGPYGSSKYVDTFPLRFYPTIKSRVVEVPRMIIP